MADITNIVHNIDARNILSVLPKEAMIQTTITSPPYYDMKDYGVNNQIGFGQSYEAYLDDLQSIFEKVLHRTTDDGTLWIIIDTFKRNGSIVPLPFDLANRLRTVGWCFQDIIVWKKDKTVPWSSNGFTQKKIEYILFFSKNKRYKYNKDIIRIYDPQQLKKWWIKYPERYNPKGKTLDQVWEFPIPVQGSWGKKYIRHFCPLPQDMVATMLSLSTDEGDIVLDPFAGSGTVLAQCAYMKRKYIGVELNPNYIQQFQEYLQNTIDNGQKEYHSSKHDFGQSDFENLIWNLRALKYGRLLISLIEKEIKNSITLLVIKPNNAMHSSIKYVIMTDECFLKQCYDIVQKSVNIKPLSQFGITPLFDYCLKKEVNIDGYYQYSATNTSSHIKDTNKCQAKIYSNIKVDINEKDYN